MTRISVSYFVDIGLTARGLLFSTSLVCILGGVEKSSFLGILSGEAEDVDLPKKLSLLPFHRGRPFWCPGRLRWLGLSPATCANQFLWKCLRQILVGWFILRKWSSRFHPARFLDQFPCFSGCDFQFHASDGTTNVNQADAYETNLTSEPSRVPWNIRKWSLHKSDTSSLEVQLGRLQKVKANMWALRNVGFR